MANGESRSGARGSDIPLLSRPRAGVAALVIVAVLAAVAIGYAFSTGDRVWTVLQKGGTEVLQVLHAAGANVFWILALLPAAIALLYWGLLAQRAYDLRSKAVGDYVRFRREYDRYKSRRTVLSATELREPWQIESRRPRFSHYLLAGLAASVPFLLVAWLANVGSPLGINRARPEQPAAAPALQGINATQQAQPSKTHSATSPVQAPVAAPAGTPIVQAQGGKPAAADSGSVARAAPAVAAAPVNDSIKKAKGSASPKTSGASKNAANATTSQSSPTTVAAETPDTSGSQQTNEAQRPGDNSGRPDKLTSEGLNVVAGLQGLVLAGYGAFFYLLLAIIYRVNATALTPKFLMTSSLRAGTALMLGFLVGLTDLFGLLGSTTQRLAVFVLVGAFPTWAAAAIRRKAREWFKRPVPGTEPLPLELIDGIDDFISERLAELDITDIQHLFTADPADLTLRTLYPLERVIDWIDQAILIVYLKAHIVDARTLGVQGAMDMASIYRQATQKPEKTSRTAGRNGTPRDGGQRVDGSNDVQKQKPDTISQAGTPLPPGQATAPTAALQPTGKPGDAPGDDHEVCRRILADLATKCQSPLHVVYNIGKCLADDYQVQFLRDLWQRRGAPAGVGEAAKMAVDSVLDKTPLGARLTDASEDELQDPLLKKELKEALDERLGMISLEWDGHMEDLPANADLDDIKQQVLTHVQYAEHVGPDALRLMRFQFFEG